MKLVEYFITKNDCYTKNVCKADSRFVTFQERGPLGLILHSIGTPQPNAKRIADYENQPNVMQAVHAILQADGTVYQTLPWNFRGWHAGGTANNTHCGVEMSEPGTIKYKPNSATITIDEEDIPAAQEFCRNTYKTAVELFAMLCKKYELDPETDILSHTEAHKLGVASGHSDPEHLWRQLNLGYTMDAFRADVKKAMGNIPVQRPTLRKGDSGAYVKELQNDLISLNYSVGVTKADGKFGKNTEAAVKQFQKNNSLVVDGIVGKNTWAKLDEKLAEEPEPCDEIYRVRKSWADGKSQLGAFKVLANAKNCCDSASYEYGVFNSLGIELYRPKKLYKVKVKTALNIRASHTVFSKKIGLAKQGEILTIEAEHGRWGKLHDRDGWVSLNYCTKI